MMRKFDPKTWFGIAALACALVFVLHPDRAQRAWVAKLTLEGSPPPTRDPSSATGYALGQRHFLATHERGETYRWIAATQDFIANGPGASSTYVGDTPPEGRPQLLPRLYTAWLAAIAAGLHVTTGEPIALSVEDAALWEPVISHVFALVAFAAFMGIRFGATRAGVAAVFFAVFPPLFGQFLPGTLTTTTWALLLATYAIALNLPTGDGPRRQSAFSRRAAVAAGLALWLDPVFGFPAVLISASVGAGTILTHGERRSFLTWALTGGGVVLAAWFLDQSPWDPAAGELRYVHPLYAFAWLGVGVALDGWQHLHARGPRTKLYLAELVAAVPLAGSLVYTQLSRGFDGWLYTNAAMRRWTSLDETAVSHSVLDWLARASVVEVVLVGAPVGIAFVALAWSIHPKTRSPGQASSAFVIPAIVLVGVVALALFKIRWGVVATFVALPLICDLAARASAAFRQTLVAVSAMIMVGLIAWGKVLPPSFQRPSADTALKAADLEALVHRHFAHWLAGHNPGQAVSALAPPDLSDSLVFHGGCRVVLSTAWESYPGHVAASRVLSAPEASEAEAVAEGLGITHVVLSSWDIVFPLLVRDPGSQGKDTLYARLQRWVLPRFLRPVPYRLPAVPGYRDQKLAVFKVTAPQDDALSLSRLAEYFVEMERPEPARLAAQVLTDTFPDDPNARLARAVVYEYVKDQAGFGRELAHLVADTTAGRTPFAWDRRVQRAIVLVLGKRPELARAELEACANAISAEGLFELTPLQAYRLRTLTKRFLIEYPDPKLADLLDALGAEYSAVPTAPAPR